MGVEALHKPEGSGFDSRWCHWNYLWTLSSRPHFCPGIDPSSHTNEYQKHFLGCKGGRSVGLTTLPPSCFNCLKIWELQTAGTLQACTGIAFTSFLCVIICYLHISLIYLWFAIRLLYQHINKNEPKWIIATIKQCMLGCTPMTWSSYHFSWPSVKWIRSLNGEHTDTHKQTNKQSK
jgi:hypothetical protein